MKQSTKQFEAQLILKRNTIERKAIVMAKRALTAQYNSVLERIKYTDISQWTNLVENINEDIIKQLFLRIYPSASPLAVMTRKNMMNAKSGEEDVIYNYLFQTKLTGVSLEAVSKIRTITSTSKSRILKVIENVLDEGDTGGWGIDKFTSEIYKQVGQNLRGNGFARARAIAQTEVISASNQASEFAAKSTGYEYKKFWSTSGLKGIRPTHIEAEQYSDEKNGLRPDETFPNGLLYPGDPNGTAKEVINCRCSILHEIS